jgi:hypothetical protein
MTQITHLTGNYWAVEIPQDTVHIEVYDKESLPLALIAYIKDPKGLFTPGIPQPIYPLPNGQYKFLFLSSQVTEGDLKEICPVHKGFGWRDYMAANGSYQWCASALKSFHSLLQSKNLTGTYAVMEILNK